MKTTYLGMSFALAGLLFGAGNASANCPVNKPNCPPPPPEGSPFQSFLLHVGTPVTVADAVNFKWILGDYDRDGIPDLYGIKTANTASGVAEIAILSGASNYQTYLLQTPIALGLADSTTYEWGVGDYNRDGIPDLYGIKVSGTASLTKEVHILDGASRFQSFLLHTSTGWNVADAGNNWFVGDYNLDGIPDVFAVKASDTASGLVEVHVADGANRFQTFLLHTTTPWTVADGANFKWSVTQYVGDGVPELFGFQVANTSSSDIGLQYALGTGNYQSRLPLLNIPLLTSDSPTFVWAMGDYNHDGSADLYGIRVSNTGTGNVEVHILSGN